MPDCVSVYTDLLTFSEVAALLPPRRNGAKTAISTLWRWSTRGSRGVFLRVTRIGGNVYVARADLIDFIERRSAAPDMPATPPRPTAAKSTERRLANQGL